MRRPSSQLLALVPMLLGLVLAIEPAAATHSAHALVPLQTGCPTGTGGFCEILNRMKSLLIATLSGLGIVMFLGGAGIYFSAGPRSEWAARGKWGMIGGATMVIIAQSVNLITKILEFIASGNATIVPWRLINSVLTIVHRTVLPLLIPVGGP